MNLFEFLLIQTEIRLYSPFSDCFDLKQQTDVSLNPNQSDMVNTIWFRFELIRIQKVAKPAFPESACQKYRHVSIARLEKNPLRVREAGIFRTEPNSGHPLKPLNAIYRQCSLWHTEGLLNWAPMIKKKRLNSLSENYTPRCVFFPACLHRILDTALSGLPERSESWPRVMTHGECCDTPGVSWHTGCVMTLLVCHNNNFIDKINIHQIRKLPSNE